MKIKIALSARDLGELLDALYELRDSTGEEATPLEERLAAAKIKLDRAEAVR